MRDLIVEHLETTWKAHLERDWTDNRPLLEEELNRARRLDLRNVDRGAVLKLLTGHEPDKPWIRDRIMAGRRIVYVPHAHIGQYVRVHHHDDTVWVFYGPVVPEGIDPASPLLSRREMLLRAGALADETRLQIVRLIADEGELRSQEIMERLGLSQSAASRHLTQLAAAGYLDASKVAGAKSYRINDDNVRTTTDAFRRYLLGL
jgi:DNA-binding transcriptional ArsR family regulator